MRLTYRSLATQPDRGYCAKVTNQRDGNTLTYETVLTGGPRVWRFIPLAGSYYVRVFRSSTFAKPVVLVADTGNDPAASVVNRVDEVCAILADALFQLPGVALAQLDAVARWVTVMPAGLHGPSFGETFNLVTFDNGRPRNQYLRHSEVEDLVGDRVCQLTAADCTVEALTKRGVPTMRVNRP